MESLPDEEFWHAGLGARKEEKVKDMRRFSVRRWGTVLLGACLLGGCAQAGGGQGQQTQTKEKTSLYDRGLAVIQKMDTMAESDSYMEMMGGSPEVLEVVSDMGKGDYSAPEKVWKVTVPEGAIDALFDAYGISLDSVPEEIRPDLQQRIVESAPTLVGSQAGISFIAAMSLVTATEYFVDQELTEDTIYFYMYGGTCSGAVVFSVHDEDIVSATGHFVSNEMLGEMEDEDGFGQILAMRGLAGVQISEVSPR